MRYPKPYKPAGLTNYYFFYTDNEGKRCKVSTHCDRRGDADDFVRDFIDARTSRSGSMSFKEYQTPFFVWDTCPHVQRLLDARHVIGTTHVRKCRSWLDTWILKDDPFCRKPMNRITHGDLLDLRKRIRARVVSESVRARDGGLNTVNKAMAALGTIFFEAALRGDIPNNPAAGLGTIKYDRSGPDVLSLEELHLLFDTRWKNELAWRVFRFAELTGMRCGEILGLHGRQLDGDVLTIDTAVKDRYQFGLPKWNKTREIDRGNLCLGRLLI